MNIDELIEPGPGGAAMFRTLCELMGLTPAVISAELGANNRNVRRWLGTEGPPPDAVEWITDQWLTFLERTHDALEAIDDMERSIDREADVVQLSRYTSDAAAWRGAGMSREQHGAQVRAIVLALALEDRAARVNYLPEDRA